MVQPARQAYSAVVAGQSGSAPQGVQNAVHNKIKPREAEKTAVAEAARLKAPFSSHDTLHPIDSVVQPRQAPTRAREPRRRKLDAPQPPQPQYQILQREPKAKLDIARINLPPTEEVIRIAKVKTVEPSDTANSSPRRARKTKSRAAQVQDGTLSQASSYKGKGWRQSPMLKEVVAHEDLEVRAGFVKVKGQKNAKSKRVRRAEATGWATEDATDIQELGEFDFEANLANFDKASVFAQLRREDDVPEEERLVSHNKLAQRTRPGTFGGTKLHPTENVLDHPSPTIISASRRGSARYEHRSVTSDDSSSIEEDNRGGKSSARLMQRRFPARGSTTNLLKMERPNTDPVLSSRLETSIHSLKRPSNTASSTSNGPVHRMTPSESEGLIAENAHGRNSNVHLYIGGKNLPCPVITPGGMTALEDLARSEHRYKHNLINENAGRSLAEIIINDVLARKIGPSKTRTAIFFVGNHRAGARALVAARHLMGRGFSPVCCVLGLDRPGSQLDVEADRQINMVRHTPGAVVANWREVQKYLLVNEEQGKYADVWIDALVAPGHSYDTLVPEDQNAVREMVAWANRRPPSGLQRSIYSIDIPCGINASTGEITITEKKTRIQMRSSHIVCMGAPRTGLLIALRNAFNTLKTDTANRRQSLVQVESLLHGSVHVVDIGVNEVWKEYGQQLGLATGSGVDFEYKWYLTLTLDSETNREETWETE